ncbi:MAG TPA: SGNH/GDSL hydrolase family protein [Gaiellaceae bacterium]
MKTVLCFGDSNTWGYVPGSDGERWSSELRWPRRLATALGGEWDVIAEGLNGRTATMDSPVADGRNGLTYLLPCLHSHRPLDVVVIYLGTNDAGDRYSLPAETVAGAVGRLVKVVRTSEAGPGGAAPEVLVVCPPPFGQLDPEGSFANAGAKSRQLGRWFADVCRELDCELLDLNGIAAYSDVDGIHLDAEGQAAVAAAVEERVRRMSV